MDVVALRSKVTFQKNETVTDKYGNHKKDSVRDIFHLSGASGDHRALVSECADSGGE